MKMIKSVLPKAAMAFLIFTILTGVIYTAFVTGVAQLFFPHQANGSIIEGNDGRRYSMLLGQQFTGDIYLHGRAMDYDVESFRNADGKIQVYAWASNLSPAGVTASATPYRDGIDGMNELVAERVARVRTQNPEMGNTPIPVELVTISGSGLDPHISPAAAEYQVARIARARGISANEVRAIIEKNTEGKFLGMMGEEVVHVLKVNLMLDGILD